ncbi:MAG: hypothetical protein PHW73_05265 [Atribacterota bacterium]|nr:hypothetical protein [Atribacterota bacterium]
MTKKELTRAYVIKSLIEDKITSQDAVGVLSLRERYMKGLRAGVKKGGEVSYTPTTDTLSKNKTCCIIK